MTDCVVKKYCLSAETTRGICRKCKEYNKFERKKSKSAVAIGRSNKRKGKKSEKKLLLHFQRQGFEARIIEGSGAYKKVRKDADSDLRVIIKGKERKIENKKRQDFSSIRKSSQDKILHITGFCYAMNEHIFYDIAKNYMGRDDDYIMVSDGGRYTVKESPDRDYGWLHKFFGQDDADIVTLDESYKDFIFCVSEKLFKEVIT